MVAPLAFVVVVLMVVEKVVSDVNELVKDALLELADIGPLQNFQLTSE